MKCTIKEQESCDVEKMTCKGCAYNEKSADEMFEELGYICDSIVNIGAVYYKYYNKEEDTIIMFWVDKTVCKYNELGKHYITMQELQAINKKVKELGWYE